MATKQKVSERDYLDASGNVTDKIEAAAGARYTLGYMDGEKFTKVASWDQLFGEPGKKTTMFGILGFHTKLGNIANSVLNNDKNPGGPKDAANAVEEFIASDTWREPGTGVGVTRYDVALLAEILAQVTGRPADSFTAKMQWRVDAKGSQVQPDANGEFPKGALTYPAFAMKNAKVRAAYDAKKGTGPELDAL